MSKSLFINHFLANDQQPVLKVTDFSRDRVASRNRTRGKSEKTAFWLKGAFGLKAHIPVGRMGAL